jgi:hypothetical protein
MTKIMLIACLLLSILGATAFSQSAPSAAEIRGSIADSTGRPVSDVQVTATNSATGLSFRALTNAFGDYRFLILSPGNYELAAERQSYVTQVRKEVQITVGQVSIVNFKLTEGSITLVVDVTETLPLNEPERTQQSNTIVEDQVRQLPIDRRDFLTYSLLTPGIADATTTVDDNEFRPVQTASSGLSFYGNNGRGNSLKIDGGEADNAVGGVRPNLSQEAVQEFQINRGNYSAELGAANGGVINIVSRSGTNLFRGSVFGFFRHQSLDAADPFARELVNGQSVRVKPPSNRQQFGVALGGPLVLNRTFFFSAFEGLERRESNAVSIVTDPSIFELTPDQESILAGLPPSASDPLRQALQTPQATRQLFEENAGVFPFNANDYKFSTRVDHRLRDTDQLMFRYNFSNQHESNPNARALIGVSRAIERSVLNHTALLSWKHNFTAQLVNQVGVQFDYGDLLVSTRDKFGPEINIDGFGYFNRDLVLPSRNIARRSEFTESLSVVLGAHTLRAGGQLVVRGTNSENHALFPGRFNFGSLPGAVVSPALAQTSITALQAFNLGLPQYYQQGFGDPTVSSTDPFYGLYVQDTWRISPSLTADLGVRYEIDDRRDPVPTDRNNIAPRVGFAWSPGNDRRTTFRGGYGIFYSPLYYFVDWTANALSDLNGHRQIAQVLTTLSVPGAANASNIYRTLRAQGVITLPTPTRSINPGDLEQFGITIAHDGPLPGFSALFRSSDDLVNAYSQHISFGLSHELSTDLLIAANYLSARTLKIIRSRDQNLLPAPIDPNLGIRVWSAPFFKQPLLLQDNVYESSGRASYHALAVEVKKRFSHSFSLDFNYTLSKAMDDVVDYPSDYQANDQADLSKEWALSSFDVRHKLVFYSTLRSPAGSGGILGSSLFANMSITPVIRGNTSRPFNLLAGLDLNADRHSTNDRPPLAGRNTGRGPGFWTTDVRISRTIHLPNDAELEAMVDVFNLFNRLNFRGVNNTVGNISGPFNLEGRKELSPSQPLGFTSAFDPRRIQLGLRLTF